MTNAVGQTLEFTWLNARVVKVKDPAGNEWNYTYNAAGMLASASSPGPSSDQRSYVYENASDNTLLTGIFINGTRYSKYTYFLDKRVQESGLTGGEQRDTFTYATNQTTVMNAAGQPVAYTYSSVQGGRKLSSVSCASTTTCAAASAQTVYDANGWVDYSLDWNGNKTDYLYDITGKLLQVTYATGTANSKTEVNTWSGDDLIEVTYRDSANAAYAKRAYTYVAIGLAQGKVASDIATDLRTGVQRTISYGYIFNANGTLVTMSVTQALPSGSAITVYSYDGSGNLVSTTNALGHQTTWSLYNALGLPGRRTDASGVVTDFTYEPKGNLASMAQYVNGGTRTTTFSYNNDRQVTDVFYANGAVDRARYTASGRLQYMGNALNEFVFSGVDMPTNTVAASSVRHVPSLSGNSPVASAVGQFSATTRLDSLQRPRQDLGNSGQQVTYAYDGNGNLLTRTDAGNRVTSYSYDALNRVKTLTAPDNGIVTYNYDTEGQLQWVRDQRMLVTSFTYSGLGDVLTQTSPDSGRTTYTYDSAGRMATKALANGVTISYGWDKLGRQTSRSSAGLTETFTYDEGTYGKGRLTRMNDATGQTTYAYSAAGELVQQVNVIYGNSYTTGWTYDVAGRLTAMSYPTGLSLGYTYDAYGRLSAVFSNLGGTWGTLADSFLYQPATNRRYAWRFGNNLPKLVTLDTDGRITQLASGGVHNLGFGYSNVDTLTSRSDGFYASPLEAQLRAAGRTHLLMAGFAAEITVDSTLRGANDP